MNYTEFLKQKAQKSAASGFPPSLLNPVLFDFQRDMTAKAIQDGRGALFADCGLGKTLMQIEWAREVAHHTKGKCLIVAPLAVSSQTVEEGRRFGIDLEYVKTSDDCDATITITNYERLQNFDPSRYKGVVLDESSILKNYAGKTRTMIIDMFRDTPYKLACTATPAPNDILELSNHSEFLNKLPRSQMLALYFVNDFSPTKSGKSTGLGSANWRLKAHAETHFWDWVKSWASLVRKPSDLGYPDDKFILPDITYYTHEVDVSKAVANDSGMLFLVDAQTLSEQRAIRRMTVDDRVAVTSDMVNRSTDPWVVWCFLNEESVKLKASIPDAVEVKGSDSIEEKESRLLAFSGGDARVLITKPSIAGFGMNWQHCPNMAFCGITHSFEEWYQAVRRCWRFGQTRKVSVHHIISEVDGKIVSNLNRKFQEFNEGFGGVKYADEIISMGKN